MGSILKFLTLATADGVFNEEHTSEQLLEKLQTRENCDDRIVLFLRHMSKTALLNLTVLEMLSGQRSAAKMESYGLDHLQRRSLARSTDDRVAVVMREGRYWDDELAKAQAVRASVAMAAA